MLFLCVCVKRINPPIINKMDSARKLIVRCKPASEQEVWKVSENGCGLKLGSGEEFKVDMVSNGDSHTDFYNKHLSQWIADATINGYSLTILAYGLPKSGKTHCMMGTAGQSRTNPEARGVIARCLDQMAEILQGEKKVTQVTGSFCHIFSDGRVADLLDTKKRNLRVEEVEKDVYHINGCTQQVLTKPEDVVRVIEKAHIMRNATGVVRQAQTEESNPLHRYKPHGSHAVFQYVLEHISNVEDENSKVLVSNVTLIDLAGHSILTHFAESICTDVGLSALHSVLEGISNGGDISKASEICRSTSLTRLLYPCLFGNSRCLVVSTLPLDSDIGNQTLKFLLNFKNCKNSPSCLCLPMASTKLGNTVAEINEIKVKLAMKLTGSKDLLSWEVENQSSLKINGKLFDLEESSQELLLKIMDLRKSLLVSRHGQNHLSHLNLPQSRQTAASTSVSSKPQDPLLSPPVTSSPLTLPRVLPPLSLQPTPRPVSLPLVPSSSPRIPTSSAQTQLQSSLLEQASGSTLPLGVVPPPSTTSATLSAVRQGSLSSSDSDSEPSVERAEEYPSGCSPLPPLNDIPHILPSPTNQPQESPFPPQQPQESPSLPQPIPSPLQVNAATVDLPNAKGCPSQDVTIPAPSTQLTQNKNNTTKLELPQMGARRNTQLSDKDTLGERHQLQTETKKARGQRSLSTTSSSSGGSSPLHSPSKQRMDRKKKRKRHKSMTETGPEKNLPSSSQSGKGLRSQPTNKYQNLTSKASRPNSNQGRFQNSSNSLSEEENQDTFDPNFIPGRLTMQPHVNYYPQKLGAGQQFPPHWCGLQVNNSNIFSSPPQHLLLPPLQLQSSLPPVYTAPSNLQTHPTLQETTIPTPKYISPNVEEVGGKREMAKTEEQDDKAHAISEREIHQAAMEGVKSSYLKKLVMKYGVDYQDQYYRTPLMYAVLGNQPRMCEVLLNLEADVNAVDSSGHTALLWATIQAKPEIMKILLKSGANIHICDPNGRSPFHWAMKTPNAHCLKLLCKFAALGIENKADKEHLTPLHWAVMAEQPQHIRILLTSLQSADINPQDSKGRTPLNYAVLNFSPVCIKALMDARTSDVIKHKDTNGRTALHYACAESSADCVRTILASKSCDLHVRDIKGTTPLHWAAAGNQPGIVQLLLRRGADRAQTDNAEMTPLDYAIQRGHSECVQILKSYGLQRPSSAWSIASQFSVHPPTPPELDQLGHVPLKRPNQHFSLSGNSLTSFDRLPADGHSHTDDNEKSSPTNAEQRQSDSESQADILRNEDRSHNQTESQDHAEPENNNPQNETTMGSGSIASSNWFVWLFQSCTTRNTVTPEM